MKNVAKYNLYKGISTVLTIGTPMVTLLSCSELFVHRSETAISAAGMFTLFIVVLFFKDKIAENLKVPSAFVLSLVSFILLLMIEEIMLPMKYVCIATMCTSGIDELTFKRFYKTIERRLPDSASDFKYFGFIFSTTDALTGGSSE